MAPTRKSAKRAAGKKRSAKRGSTRKRAVRKATARRGAKSRGRSRKKSSNLRRQAKKGLQAARSGIDTVREAGDKAWSALKSTTAQVVEGVKDRLGEETERGPNYRQ
jgi:hypothetical protein